MRCSEMIEGKIILKRVAVEEPRYEGMYCGKQRLKGGCDGSGTAAPEAKAVPIGGPANPMQLAARFAECDWGPRTSDGAIEFNRAGKGQGF